MYILVSKQITCSNSLAKKQMGKEDKQPLKTHQRHLWVNQQVLQMWEK